MNNESDNMSDNRNELMQVYTDKSPRMLIEKEESQPLYSEAYFDKPVSDDSGFNSNSAAQD